jgi:hypothetical protein
VGDGQPTTLGAGLTNEILSGTGTKKNGNGVSLQGEHTGEDLLTLKNIFHGCIVDVAGLCNCHLLWTTWRMSDMALSGILLWCGAVSSEVARATTVEAGVAGGGPTGRWCRQVHHRRAGAGASTEVGGEPIATADAGASAAPPVRVGRWSRGGTLTGTWQEHYVTRTYSYLLEVATRHSQVSTHPRNAVMTHHTTDVSPYHTIGIASSKPLLEVMGGLEFTSPSRRILTFLPCHRCVIIESKSLLPCHPSRL